MLKKRTIVANPCMKGIIKKMAPNAGFEPATK